MMNLTVQVLAEQVAGVGITQEPQTGGVAECAAAVQVDSADRLAGGVEQEPDLLLAIPQGPLDAIARGNVLDHDAEPRAALRLIGDRVDREGEPTRAVGRLPCELEAGRMAAAPGLSIGVEPPPRVLRRDVWFAGQGGLACPPRRGGPAAGSGSRWPR